LVTDGGAFATSWTAAGARQASTLALALGCTTTVAALVDGAATGVGAELGLALAWALALDGRGVAGAAAAGGCIVVALGIGDFGGVRSGCNDDDAVGAVARNTGSGTMPAPGA
jgi:hypothetical protein